MAVLWNTCWADYKGRLMIYRWQYVTNVLTLMWHIMWKRNQLKLWLLLCPLLWTWLHLLYWPSMFTMCRRLYIFCLLQPPLSILSHVGESYDNRMLFHLDISIGIDHDVSEHLVLLLSTKRYKLDITSPMALLYQWLT